MCPGNPKYNVSQAVLLYFTFLLRHHSTATLAQIPACRSFESPSQYFSLILSWCFLPSPSLLHHRPQGSQRFLYGTFSVFLVLGLCTCFSFDFLQCDVSIWWNSHMNQFAGGIHWIFCYYYYYYYYYCYCYELCFGFREIWPISSWSFMILLLAAFRLMITENTMSHGKCISRLMTLS